MVPFWNELSKSKTGFFFHHDFDTRPIPGVRAFPSYVAVNSSGEKKIFINGDGDAPADAIKFAQH